VLGGDGCVWYMVSGTGCWIEGLLDFVVWSGMHECSCSTVLLIAFSPPHAPAPPSLLPLSFNILLSVLLSPLSISRHKPKPLLAPHSPSQLIPPAPLYHNSQFPTPRQNPSHLLTSPSHSPSNYLRPTKLSQEEKNNISFSCP